MSFLPSVYPLFWSIQMCLFWFTHLIIFYYYSLGPSLFSNERQAVDLDERRGGEEYKGVGGNCYQNMWEKNLFSFKGKNNKTIFKCFNSLMSQNNKILANIMTQFFFYNILHKFHLSQRKHRKYNYVNDKMEFQQRGRMSIFNKSQHQNIYLFIIYLYREWWWQEWNCY